MKNIVYLLLVVFPCSGWTQGLYMGSAVSWKVSEDATVEITGDAVLSKNGQNDGVLWFGGDVELDSAMTSLGAVVFSGQTDQKLSADSVEIQDLNMTKSGDLVLDANFIRVQRLSLNKGIVKTAQCEFWLNETTVEGDHESYVFGKIHSQYPSSTRLFPLGIDGAYQPITLSGLSNESKINIAIQKPVLDELYPGDSLVGVSDFSEWEIKCDNEDVSVNVLATFSGHDLTQFTETQTIRANRYGPVLVQYAPVTSKYKQLGIASLENTDSLSYGTLEAIKTVNLISGKSSRLSVGKMPLRSGLYLFVPDVFSPNAFLEENRVFRPFFEGVEMSRINFLIWNSHGNLIYSKDENITSLEEVGWNGELPNGEMGNEGVYVYSMTLSTNEGEYERSGSFIMMY